MQRKFSVFIFVIFMATTGLARRSCVDVQNTMMTCISNSDLSIMGQTGHPDMVSLCRTTSQLISCVEDARSGCPNLPLLADPDFSRSIEAMETLRETHCANAAPEQTTSDPMQGDQAESCDPLEAMMRCNDIMVNVRPGDIKAMCIPGEEFLTCMSQIVHSCPEHSDLLPFDLQQAIDTTRALLDQECPADQEDQSCAAKIEKAKTSCGDATLGIPDVCGSMQAYMECMDITFMSCPDRNLKLYLTDQLHNRCGQPLPEESHHGGGSKCPDDLQSAMMTCSRPMEGVHPGDMDSYCRASRETLACVDALAERCENDARFDMFPRDQMQQHITNVCPASGGQPLPEENNHGDGSECPDDLQSVMMTCVSGMQGADPSDMANFCRVSKGSLECLEGILASCQNDPRAAMFPSDMTDQIRMQINTVCPNGGQPLPEESNHGGGSECPDNLQSLQSAVMTCVSDMQGVDASDMANFCRVYKGSLECLEGLLANCQNDSLAAMFPSDMTDQMRQQISSLCPNGGQPLPEESNHGGDSECPDDLQSAMMTCVGDMQGADPSNMASLCSVSKRSLECFEGLQASCQNDPRAAMLPSHMTDDLRQQISSLCPNDGQPLPEESNHGGEYECPDDLRSAIMTCVSGMQGADPRDMANFCRVSKGSLKCLEGILASCQNDPRAAMFPSDMTDQMHQQISSLCPNDENRRAQPKARTRYPLRTLRQLLFP